MLYLEDYIELIEHLPDELRDRLTEMREMDLNVQNTIDSVNVRAENFFARSRRVKSDDRDKEFERIYADYQRVHEEAQEKAALADKMHGLFAKHLRKLDQELLKFKMELEADNSGITEVLEKRSLELDGASGAAGGSSHKPLYLRNLAYANRKHDTRKNGSNKKPLNRLGTGPTFQAFRSGHGVGNLKNGISKPDLRLIGPGQAGKNGTLLKQQQHIYLDDGEEGSNPIAAAASQAIVATQQLQLGRRSSSLKASYEAAKNSDLKSLTKDFAATKKRNTNSSSLISSQAVGNSLSGNQSPTSFFGKSNDASKASFDDVSFSPTITNLIQNAKFNPNPARDEVFTPSNTGNNAGLSLLNLASTDQSVYGFHNAPFDGQNDDPYADSSHFLAPQPPHKRVAPNWNGTGVLNWNRRRNARSDRDNLGRDREDVRLVGDEDDPDEPRYCVCHQVSYGEMVACDNPGCPHEWFHYPCVGINQPPKGKWYCPRCVSIMPNLNNPSGQR